MSKKVKVLIVFSFIFLILTSLAFILSSVLFYAMTTITEDGVASDFGEAIGYVILILYFIVVMFVFGVLDVINIVFGAILIKLTAEKWRVFYIVETAVSGVMAAAEAVFFLIVIR